ncbi:MAG: hypothetical protein I8H71_00270 [Xanthomonadaceae bacterium]|nr:hypothetical protein [Xanthomonadaceae bacterium]MBH2008107.1 hypothetical protein [Xanthomonadaceae bacterium]
MTTKPRTAPAHVLRPSVMKAPTPEVQIDEAKARRHADIIARLSQGRVPSPTITNASTTRNYAGMELKPYAGRPGTAQASVLPSRVGSRLRYPDGRVTDLAGNLLNNTWSKS